MRIDPGLGFAIFRIHALLKGLKYWWAFLQCPDVRSKQEYCINNLIEKKKM